MRILYGSHFLASVRPLQKAQQKKLASLLEVLSENPFHHFLHTKRLVGPLGGFLSFRITRDWRVMFQFLDSQTIQLMQVAHRKDVYRDT